MNIAWKEAERLAELLPRTARWSFTITELEDDAVLNIYEYPEHWDLLRIRLGLTRQSAETGTGYMTWFNGSLAISLIVPEPEEEDGPESDDDAR